MAIITSKLQSDRYEKCYFHEIWMEIASGILILKFIRCQNTYQLQNLKIISIFQEHKNPHGQTFWNLFFLSKKTWLYRYYHNRNQLGVILSSYINLSMKLLIKLWSSPKNMAKMKFYIFGKVASQFCFR